MRRRVDRGVKRCFVGARFIAPSSPPERSNDDERAINGRILGERVGGEPGAMNRARTTVFAALLLVCVALAANVSAVAAQDIYSEETLEIARKLQCPVCQGQSVADSNSQLARQMRDIIERRVQAGESEEEIIAYFVASYGDWIVTEPEKSGFSLGLWWMPVLVVVLGVSVVALSVRERTRPAPAVRSAPNEDEELEAIAREVLGPPGSERTSGA